MTDQTIRPLERAFHIVALALQCGAILPLFSRITSETASLGYSNPLNAVANAIMLVIVLGLMVRHRAKMWRFIPALTLILALTLLALASTLWSDYPDITIRRSGVLLTTTLWAWYVAARFTSKDIIKLIAYTIGLMAVASLGTAVLAPDIGIEALPPGWRGVFYQKNGLGDIMAVGFITYFYLMLPPPRRRGVLFVYFSGFLLCAFLLILSQSRTSWMIGLIGPAIVLVLKLMRGRAGIAIAVWVVGPMLLLLALVFIHNEIVDVAPLLGRETNLTGRIGLWSAIMPFIASRPLLGYGMGAFWVESSRNVADIWDTIGWHAAHGHNGWLDLILQLGVVGCAVLAAQVFFLFVRGTRAVINNRDPDAPYFLLMLSVILIHNITESALFREQNVMWALIVISTVSLAKISRSCRVSASAEDWSLGKR